MKPLETRVRQFEMRRMKLCVILGAWIIAALFGSVTWGQYYAYVTNAGGDMGSHIKGSVSVIDLATNTVVATVPVGEYPQGVAVNPAGTAVYVANSDSNEVTVIDTATRDTTTIPAGEGPVGIAVHPDGTRIYVANVDDVSVIDRATNTIVDKIVCGTRPIGLAVHPDGSIIYVANVMDGTVTVFNTETHQVVDTIELEPAADDEGWASSPVAMVLHPDGTYLYVANRVGSTLSAINTATHEYIARSFAHNHCGIALNRTGTILYLPDFDAWPMPPTGTTMDVINAETLEPITTVEGLAGPMYVSVHPEGTRLYITNHMSDKVSVIDVGTYEVITDIPVGKYPTGFGNFIGPGVPRMLMDDAAARLEAVKEAVAAGAEGVNSPQQALNSLETALTAATGHRQMPFWPVGTDGAEDLRRLRRVEGVAVFTSNQAAVKGILDALRRGWIVNPEIETELLAIADEIVRADRVLAAVVIDDAIVARADSASLDQAQEMLVQAHALVKEAGVWPVLDRKSALLQEAIAQYQKTWEAARALVP